MAGVANKIAKQVALKEAPKALLMTANSPAVRQIKDERDSLKHALKGIKRRQDEDQKAEDRLRRQKEADAFKPVPNKLQLKRSLKNI